MSRARQVKRRGGVPARGARRGQVPLPSPLQHSARTLKVTGMPLERKRLERLALACRVRPEAEPRLVWLAECFMAPGLPLAKPLSAS